MRKPESVMETSDAPDTSSAIRNEGILTNVDLNIFIRLNMCSHGHYEYTVALLKVSLCKWLLLEMTSIYRGIHVDNKLRLRDHAEIAAAKANKILGLIRRSYEYVS